MKHEPGNMILNTGKPAIEAIKPEPENKTLQNLLNTTRNTRE